jgi:3-deoxy-D-manno-octulosonic-acid transferase
MSFLLYNLAFVLLSPAIAVWIFVRLFLQRRARDGWKERVGEAPLSPPGEPQIWVHAVSAGEVVAAAPVVRALKRLRPDVGVVVSTITPGGLAQARRLIGEARVAFYFPIDFWPFVWRALARVRPILFVAVETELWPNFLRAAARRGIPTAIVNGRFSDRTLRRLDGPARLALPLYAAALRGVGRLAMQTTDDAERAVALGAPRERVTVCGNTKFDQAIVSPPSTELESLRHAFGLRADQPLWIAGSTHPGEEEQVLAAWHEVRADLPDLALMIAPRHIERADAVAALCRAAAPDHPLVRRSQMGFDPPAAALETQRHRERREERAVAAIAANAPLRGSGAACVSSATGGEPLAAPLPPLILLDTLGELAGMYALASVVFVGGSLAPIGGHDVLQPLFHGKPTFFGPHMHNQRDLATLSLSAGAVRQVADAGELASAVREVLTQTRAQASMARGARLLLEAHRGAAEASAAAALELLPKGA